MSSNIQDIKGPIVCAGRVEAQPGKADELAQWFANFKARAESNVEPGTLHYHAVRFGDSFSVYEEYTDLEALLEHTEHNPLFQEFAKVQDTLMKPISGYFWPAESLPEPSKNTNAKKFDDLYADDY